MLYTIVSSTKLSRAHISAPKRLNCKGANKKQVGYGNSPWVVELYVEKWSMNYSNAQLKLIPYYVEMYDM